MLKSILAAAFPLGGILGASAPANAVVVTYNLTFSAPTGGTGVLTLNLPAPVGPGFISIFPASLVGERSGLDHAAVTRHDSTTSDRRRDRCNSPGCRRGRR